VSDRHPTLLLEVVIVSYGAWQLLDTCLRSLHEHGPTAGGMEVHVIDNASPDDTPDRVAAAYPGVQLHRLDRNTGFSRANNVILSAARTPYVLVLNPDTELRAGVLDHLLAGLREHPEVGMVGPRLIQPDGTFDHAAKRSFPTPTAALAHFTGIGRRAGTGKRLGQYRATQLDEHDAGPVDAINGAFMLVRREALAEVGGFDEGYWLYMEDLDWCARFWERGWGVRYDGTVTAIHVKGGTAGVHRAFRQNLHFHRGMGRFYRRHQAGHRPLVDLLVYVAIGLKLAVSATRSAVARRR